MYSGQWKRRVSSDVCSEALDAVPYTRDGGEQQDLTATHKYVPRKNTTSVQEGIDGRAVGLTIMERV